MIIYPNHFEYSTGEGNVGTWSDLGYAVKKLILIWRGISQW